MATHNFEHLSLPLRRRAPALLGRPPKASPQTRANKGVRRAAHATEIQNSATALVQRWAREDADRAEALLPTMPAGKPFLLAIDPSLDPDALRHYFGLEVVAEQDDGFVLVATEDLQLSRLNKLVAEFSVQVHGSATVASVHKLYGDGAQIDRLERLLSESLMQRWSSIKDDELLLVDFGVECVGAAEIPNAPDPIERGKSNDAKWARRQADWAAKHAEWTVARDAAYRAWDEEADRRRGQFLDLLHQYRAEVFEINDRTRQPAALPDSLTFRVRISGIGFRDLVLNYAFLFEVVEPDDVAFPEAPPAAGSISPIVSPPLPPAGGAPRVCVIDSGIQEGNPWLAPAIDSTSSRCFLPSAPSSDVADHVGPAGHGTRVAGAVLYGDALPSEGAPRLPCWIQNARVLDDKCRLPETLFPPGLMRAIVGHFHNGARGTRIFNQSINAQSPCRRRHMSAWAATIDHLSAEHDILFVQSVGNLRTSSPGPWPGIAEHLAQGRGYPEYLFEDSSRVANPGQSLQALTVGSIAYGAFEANGWRSIADREGAPSAFSRTGLGPWDVLKPELVEYGGDALVDANHPPAVKVDDVGGVNPPLLRSTLRSVGPAHSRDQGGTSFSAPKVARIAAAVQAALPGEPSLLHRALLVQSARWPSWAESLLVEARRLSPNKAKERPRREECIAQAGKWIRSLGYGIPDGRRATTNSNHRVTLVTSGARRISAGDCDIYQVPVPRELRSAANEFDVRIDVTLSYVAQPRRTRRNLRRYLSTWLDWVSSKLDEPLGVFERRVAKDIESPDDASGSGEVLPWVIHEKVDSGLIRTVRRNGGTVQKDWAIVKAHALPKMFCIAVRGHRGWSRDPDAEARYALAVTLDVLGEEVPIYESIRVAVESIGVKTDVEEEVRE